MKKTQIISTSQTYRLRNLVLRTGMPVESCHFDGDDDEHTFHMGLIQGKQISCIVSFYKVPAPEVDAQNSYQLRGMSTHPDMQGQGLGKQIIIDGIEELKKRNCDIIWCNARTSAQKFYEKMGFEIHGEVFDIATVGPHIVMFLYLTST